MQRAILGLLPIAAIVAALAGGGTALADGQAAAPVEYTVSMTPSLPTDKPTYRLQGGLRLTIDAHGIVNGVYRGDALGNGPVVGNFVQVTGGRDGDIIRLTFGSGYGFSASGTVDASGTIVGRGQASDGRFFDFVATVSPS